MAHGMVWAVYLGQLGYPKTVRAFFGKTYVFTKRAKTTWQGQKKLGTEISVSLEGLGLYRYILDDGTSVIKDISCLVSALV